MWWFGLLRLRVGYKLCYLFFCPLVWVVVFGYCVSLSVFGGYCGGKKMKRFSIGWVNIFCCGVVLWFLVVVCFVLLVWVFFVGWFVL